MSVSLSSSETWCFSRLPRIDWEAYSRAEERTCHSIVRFKVHFNAVVVGARDKDWATALRSSSLVLWLRATRTLGLCIGFSLRAGGWTVSRDRIDGIEQWSVESSSSYKTRLISLYAIHRAWQWRNRWVASVWILDASKKSCNSHEAWKGCLWWQGLIQSRKIS